MIVGDDAIAAYGLGSHVERWEGIFEDGGKREYVKYDRTSDTYPQESSEGSETIDGMVGLLKDQLKGKGLTAGELLAKEEPLRIAEYREIAGLLGLRGGRKQEDVYGLVEMLLRKL